MVLGNHILLLWANHVPRQIVVNTSHKDAVLAAARSFGVQALARTFARADLERLKTPVLAIIDAGRVADLGPEELQTLRRTNRGGARLSPMLVFCGRGDDAAAWRAAGAVTLPHGASIAAIKKGIQEALDGARAWVTSSTYVGPCRRKHTVILNWRKRRTADAVKRAEAKGQAQTEGRVGSVDQIVRRLTLSATLLSGSTIESRRAFRDLANDLAASANAHGRGDISGPISHLRREADAFVNDGQRSNARIEAILAEISQALTRPV